MPLFQGVNAQQDHTAGLDHDIERVGRAQSEIIKQIDRAQYQGGEQD